MIMRVLVVVTKIPIITYLVGLVPSSLLSHLQYDCICTLMHLIFAIIPSLLFHYS